MPSQLVFSIEMDTGRVLNISERMDFVTPIAALLQDKEELSCVMSRALLSLDGVSHYHPHEAAALVPPLACQGSAWERSNASPVPKTAVKSRMSMADILLVWW